jgi:hypothetical protein
VSNEAKMGSFFTRENSTPPAHTQNRAVLTHQRVPDAPRNTKALKDYLSTHGKENVRKLLPQNVIDEDESSYSEQSNSDSDMCLRRNYYYSYWLIN